MHTTEDDRKYAAEQGIAEEEALKQGMEAKAKEFWESRVEVCAKAKRLAISGVKAIESLRPMTGL